VTWEAATGREAVEVAKRERPDISILDLGMPEMNGLEATRQILHEQPKAQVLILTMHESEQLIREVLDSGARGYVLKTEAGKELVSAVHALRQHNVFFTSKVASIVLADYLKFRQERRTGDAASHVLSPREREIVQLLAEGKSNKEVASTLNISVKTAETHRHRIMQKLELNSVVDLVHYAIRNHIAEL
jgi:DNA-binding NarL/FixJ family response regulator